MKARIDRRVLADAVAHAVQALTQSPVLPVLAGLLVEAAEGTLTVSGFDYGVSTRAVVDAVVDEPGRVLIPGRMLAQITKSLSGDEVAITLIGQEVTIACGSTEFALLTMPVEDYPSLPALPGKAGTAEGAELAKAIAQVAAAADKDDTLPMLTGMRMEIEGDTLALAATDRYQLAVRELAWLPSGEVHSAVLPAHALAKLAKSFDGSVNVFLGDTLAGFESGGRVTTIRLLDNQFPDWRHHLAARGDITATVEVKALASAVKRVDLMADRGAPVRLTWARDQVLVRAGGGDMGRGTESLPITLTALGDGDPTVETAVNGTYMQAMLAGVTSSTAHIHLHTAHKPVLIEDPASSYRAIVMPVRQR